VKVEMSSNSSNPGSVPTVRIKICGLTRIEDARLAVSLGADYLGFIFAPSPRQIAPEAAGSILRDLEAERSAEHPRIEGVGVFVDADRVFVEKTARLAGLTMVQLHGDEDPEYCGRIELPVIKALHIRDRGIFDQVRRYPTPYILIEPHVPGKRGGSGVQADWQLAAELVRTFPDKRFFLAGGLGPGNVRAAIQTVQPFAVDASSALETVLRIKNPQKMKGFVETVRNR
jgi:phosphoribosylanthranilate isomerase